MAGHSQFKNIMHRKGRQDAARAKLFAKLAREITVAAKNGTPDPGMNPRLRLAIQAARRENMPKDNIERAIKKALGGETAAYEAIRYEGYAPGGAAVIVEALTDNRNRTGAVRAAFTKYHGNLGAARIGGAYVRPRRRDRLSRVGGLGRRHARGGDRSRRRGRAVGRARARSPARSTASAPAAALEERLGEAQSVRAVWKPQLTTPVDEEHAQAVLKLLHALEDDDDVQNVYANFEVSDDVLRRLTAA